MLKKSSFMKRIKLSTFSKFYLLILLPAICAMLFSAICAFSYYNNYKNLLEDSYFIKLESVYQENEISLQSIAKSISLLSSNQLFMDIVSGKADTVTYDDSRAISKVLKSIQKNNSAVDNVIIIARNNRMVYTADSTYEINEYFRSVYNYQDYPVSYWKKYQAPISEKTLLPPTKTTSKDEVKTIIPMVFTKINDISISNLVIVNINLSNIISVAERSMFTENSRFQVVNKKNLLAYDIKNTTGSQINDEFYHAILQDKKASFKTHIDNQKYFVIAMSPSSSILGYTYAVTIPTSDINKNIWLVLALPILIGVLFSICALLIVRFSTRKIYNPIENLASLFQGGKAPAMKRNTIKYLQDSILNILNSNSALSSQANASLPLLQERYLIDLLNSGTYSNSEGSEQFNEKMDIAFQYNYFCSIVIKLRPTNAFYETYNHIEYESVQTAVYNMIQTILKESFITYIIPSETGMLYILLNLDTNTRQTEISHLFENIQTILKNDEKYLTLHVGLGNIYEGMDGLKKSHKEAINSVSSIPMLNQIHINSTSLSQTSYQFNMKEENTLLNFLISGKTTNAKNLIEDIVHRNKAANISEATIIQLYIQLLNIIFKVLRIKKISYDTENVGDLEIITEIITKPLSEIHTTVIDLINMISACFENTDTVKTDVNAIITYLDNNFTSDISLDLLAEQFRISPKYMSKLLKDKLGINFVDYLAILRVNKTKELLLDTDKSLSQIMEEAGFNNRSTFIRTFKKITGMIPSDYRKNFKSTNK